MNSQAPNNLQALKAWYQQVIDACDFYDTNNAFSALRQWDEMIEQLPEQQRSEIMRFKDRLLFTAFPELSLNQAVEVIEKKLLNALGGEVNIEEIIHKRFLYLGYGNQEEDRIAFRNAALKNQQLLGEKKVSEWLQAFDKTYPSEGTEEAMAGKFFAGDSSVANLSKAEQAMLKRLLQVYDQWLRAPLVSIFGMAEVYKKLDELERSGIKEINVNTFERDYFPSSGASRTNIPSAGRPQTKASSGETVSLPLLQALSKYERLGEQLITRGRIKVGSQTEPVRPSLLYWLKYYRDELGVGQHSSVERGNFLFRSENGKNLSSEEREQINIILKSVEENFPLTIDTKNQEIVFPVFRGVVMAPRKATLAQPATPSFQLAPRREGQAKTSLRAFAPTPSPVPPKVATIGTPAFFVPKPEEGEVSFSTSHIFPAEKEAAEMRVSLNEAAKGQVVVPEKEALSLSQPASPMPHQDEAAVAPSSQPVPNFLQASSVPKKVNSFRIRPVSLGGRD